VLCDATLHGRFHYYTLPTEAHIYRMSAMIRCHSVSPSYRDFPPLLALPAPGQASFENNAWKTQSSVHRKRRTLSQKPLIPKVVPPLRPHPPALKAPLLLSVLLLTTNLLPPLPLPKDKGKAKSRRKNSPHSHPSRQQPFEPPPPPVPALSDGTR
jgi:hypothetical protein